MKKITIALTALLLFAGCQSPEEREMSNMSHALTDMSRAMSQTRMENERQMAELQKNTIPAQGPTPEVLTQMAKSLQETQAQMMTEMQQMQAQLQEMAKAIAKMQQTPLTGAPASGNSR